MQAVLYQIVNLNQGFAGTKHARRLLDSVEDIVIESRQIAAEMAR
jgi:hypothetical protein